MMTLASPPSPDIYIVSEYTCYSLTIPAIITFHSTYHCTGYEPANLFLKTLFDSSSGCGIPEGSNRPSQSYPFSSFQSSHKLYIDQGIPDWV
jgi:hypothetical protein